MKTTQFSLLLGATFASLVAGAFAQTPSATTDPVGYITINVAGGGTASNPRFSAIAPTLVNATEFSGAIASVDSANQKLTFSGTPLGTLTPGYFVEVTSATADEGAWRDITANTASEITLASNFPPSVVAGNTVRIRKHVTIGSFFGTTNQAGLKPGADASEADEVIILNSSTQSLTNYFYSNFPGFEGWFDLSFNDASNVVIRPNQGLLVARKAADPVSFVFTGHVKLGKSQLRFHNGFNVLPVPLATGYQLGTPTGNLYTGSLSTGVDGGADASEADELITLNANGTQTNYFYSDFPGFTGWFDLGFNDASAVVLKEGSAVLLNRKGSGSFVWTAPAQVVAP